MAELEEKEVTGEQTDDRTLLTPEKLRKVKIYSSDIRLLEVLWEKGACRSTDLVNGCTDRYGWSKSTTFTTLRKLKGKDLVWHERAEVGARVTREMLIMQRGEEVERLSGGLVPFLCTYLSDRKLTQKEVLALKKLTEQKMSELESES